MIILFKKGVSKAENLMWAKTQMAYKNGFRYRHEDHADGCTCGREHAIKSKPLTHQDMLDAMAERTNQGDKK